MQFTHGCFWENSGCCTKAGVLSAELEDILPHWEAEPWIQVCLLL
jgi:G:T-mismatch repair DNA endonuclease (very short patch repair protein)